MKKILIATDFSQASLDAEIYGVELATAFNARVTLFSAYLDIPVAGTGSSVVVTSEDIERWNLEKLKQHISLLSKGRNIAIEPVCKKGSSPSAILKVARNTGIDLIIVGMKQKMKGLKRIIGSTVTSLCRKSPIPVLVIPEGIMYAPTKSIAVAYRTDIKPEMKMDIVRDLSDKFNSKIYLLRAVRPELKDIFSNYDKPALLLKSLSDAEVNYECDGKKITHALNGFINKRRINLLVMLHHKHLIPGGILPGSIIRSMAFVAAIPFLVLPAPRKLNNSDLTHH